MYRNHTIYSLQIKKSTRKLYFYIDVQETYTYNHFIKYKKLIQGGEEMKKNQRLIQARKDKGLTQEQFAELMNYQKSTISNWENGYSEPRLADAFRIAELLERDVNDLFFVEKEQDSHTLIEKQSNS